MWLLISVQCQLNMVNFWKEYLALQNYQVRRELYRYPFCGPTHAEENILWCVVCFSCPFLLQVVEMVPKEASPSSGSKGVFQDVFLFL
jgi:hypothetical protein